jgi:hypothetical protein
MKTIFGLSIIALGIFLEVMWLGVCFGTVIIGIVLLLFAPSILFFPFNFFLVMGLAIMHGRPIKEQAKFRYRSYTGEEKFSGEQRYSNESNQYSRSNTILDRYYEVLESKPTDDLTTIKANYRRLVKQYHYDSIASKDLPQEMVKFAEQKTQEINEAYSAIKEARK